jgi:hypothetical protein
MNIFNREINHDEIYSSLKENGAWVSNGLIKKDYINKLLLDFPNTINFNGNNNGKVVYNNQKFVSQTFVHSHNIFDMMISEPIQKIFENSLGSCTIKSARYYETGRGGISMWHHDEQKDQSAPEGLIFIIYLNEVKDENCGPFEFIKGSYKYSSTLDANDFFAKNIQKNFCDKITSVYGDTGTVIIANTKTIHRARAHTKKFVRKSLFSQISKISNTDSNYRENILLNPAFLKNKLLQDEKIRNFLGIDIENSKNIFPPSSLSTVPFERTYIKIFLKWFLNGLIKKSFEILPLSIKKKLRLKFKKNIDYDSSKGKI